MHKILGIHLKLPENLEKTQCCKGQFVLGTGNGFSFMILGPVNINVCNILVFAFTLIFEKPYNYINTFVTLLIILVLGVYLISII